MRSRDMNRSPRYGVLGLSVLLLAWMPALVAAQGRSDTKVKSAATASKLDAAGKQTVTVTLEVDKGWHIYANPVMNDLVTSIQTKVTVTSATKLADVKVQYPAGKFDAKDKLYYYDGRVTIQVQVQRAAGDTGPLDVTVFFSACDASSCLQPTSKKFTLP